MNCARSGRRKCSILIREPETLSQPNTPTHFDRRVVDVAAVGLSILSGAHRELFAEIMRRLREQGGGDILVFAGGIIPDEDLAYCRELGIQAVFTPGTPVDTAIRFVEKNVRR